MVPDVFPALQFFFSNLKLPVMISRYFRSAIYLLLLFLPVITFGIYIFENAINVPYADDEALLYTLNYFHDRPSGLFKNLVQQHNDHRVFFSRLAGVVIHLLHGTMNFRTMIIFGYLNLIILGHSIFLIYRSFRKDFLFFLPVTVLLFSPIVYCTQLWSITAFEQTLSIAFSLYCLYFLQPEKKSIWYFSMPFAIAAGLANLDGISVIPIALMWLVVQRRTKESWLFGLFSVLFTYLFFLDFKFSTASHFPEMSQFLRVVLRGFVALSGSIVKVLSDSYGYWAAINLGGFMLLTYLFFIGRKFYRVVVELKKAYNITLTEICFFKVLACVLMIALGRSGDDAESILSIRFQIYSASIFVMFYLYLLSSLESNKFRDLSFVSFFTITLTLNLLAYVKYENAIVAHNDELKVDSYNYPNHFLFIHQYPGVPDPAISFYSHYNFPEYFQREVISHWIKQVKRQKVNFKTLFKSEIFKKSLDLPLSIYPVIKFEISNLPAVVPRRDVYLALLSRNKTVKPFLIAVKPLNRSWYNHFLNSKPGPNAVSVAFPRKMASNIYDVALFWKNNNTPNSLLIARDLKIE